MNPWRKVIVSLCMYTVKSRSYKFHRCSKDSTAVKLRISVSPLYLSLIPCWKHTIKVAHKNSTNSQKTALQSICVSHVTNFYQSCHEFLWALSISLSYLAESDCFAVPTYPQSPTVRASCMVFLKSQVFLKNQGLTLFHIANSVASGLFRISTCCACMR